MASALDETRSVVQEAISVFNPAHDVEVVKAFKQTIEETKNARHQQQLALKAFIKELTATAQSKEKAIEQAESDDSSMQMISKLDKEKYHVSKALNSSEAECAALSQSLHQVGGQLVAVKGRQEALDKEAMVEIDSSIALANLYSTISNLRWDYDETHSVKGFVCNPEKNDVHPFNLNPSQSSDFYIANYLWDLIEA